MLLEKIELESGEAILKVVRKHWFIIAAEILSVAIIAFIPLILLSGALLVPELLPETVHLGTYLPIITLITSAWFLFTTMAVFMVWTNYYLDLWVVTDRRIIVIDQVSFFNRKVSSFRLERLQDIKVSINGLIATFLNFGTLNAQTASASEFGFNGSGLPDPRELQSLIQKATDERLKNLNGAFTQNIIN